MSQIEKHHDEAVQRLQQWIRQPAIGAENKGVFEGCDLTPRFLREARFDVFKKVPTDGQPGMFATLGAEDDMFMAWGVEGRDRVLACPRRHRPSAVLQSRHCLE